MRGCGVGKKRGRCWKGEERKEFSGCIRDHERVTHDFFVGIYVEISIEWKSLPASSQNHVIWCSSWLPRSRLQCSRSSVCPS